MNQTRPRTYWCTVGHPIPAGALAERTEVVFLDKGAKVRVCRDHHAPVASRDEALFPLS